MIKDSSDLWLVGTGPMSESYASVLRALNVKFTVIGRSASSCELFRQHTGIPAVPGGQAIALSKMQPPKKAILVVGVEELALCARQLLAAGCKHILLEKPGALDFEDLQRLADDARLLNGSIKIAYNRRFFSSVLSLRRLADADGGIISASFEFTEWSHCIQDLQKSSRVKERWLLANSSHVIDLAFSFIGLPADGQWQAWHSGHLDWHPASARFHGAGISVRGIPFAYRADWEAPGRWGVELLTRRNRYVLQPMESLQVIPLGSVDAQSVDLDDRLDRRFKPGLFRQCEAFLSHRPDREESYQLCSLDEQLEAFPIYYHIAGYRL